jgi:integrase
MKVLSFEQEFERANPGRIQILRFMREAVGVSEIKWSDLTLSNLNKVRELMLQRLAQNSAQVYCSIIKAFLNNVCEDVELPTMRYAKALKVKVIPSQHCCLTEEELILFDEYKPKTETEKNVKILFMRGAFSGARSSDCHAMSIDNVHGNTLSYVSKKTKVDVEQPLHARLVKYLQIKPTRDVSRSVVNRVIRRICKNLGFTEEITLFCNGRLQTKPKYEWITMHSSRRSFVTALAVRGVPVEIIAKLAGHTNSQTTSKHYVCVDIKNIGDEAMSFFNH